MNHSVLYVLRTPIFTILLLQASVKEKAKKYLTSLNSGISFAGQILIKKKVGIFLFNHVPLKHAISPNGGRFS